MVLLTLGLIWLPVIGSFLAGVVGGKKAGGVRKAFAAALIPAGALWTAATALVGAISGIPELAGVMGFGVFVLAMMEIGPLLLGAFIGGLLA